MRISDMLRSTRFAVTRIFKALMIGTLLAACGGTDSPTDMPSKTAASVLASSELSVVSLTKISESRVSRTVYEYVFSVSVKNDGAGVRTNVSANITASGRGTTVVDGLVTIGSIGAGATIIPPDTISLRHDRTQPFQPAALVWSITADSASISRGTLISGPPSARAADLLVDYFADLTRADFATAIDPSVGIRFYETQLLATIRSTATVGQVNAALTSADALIVASHTGNPTVTLLVPKQTSATQLKALTESLKASGAFQAVGLLHIPRPSALPKNVSPSEATTTNGPVFHQMAAGFGGIWPSPDSSLAANNDVEIIIVDWFGRGAPSTLQANLIAPVTGINSVAAISPTRFNFHGYHVLGIIGASYGGDYSDSGKLAGAMPLPVPIHVIDLQSDQDPQPGEEIVYPIVDGGKEVLVNWFEFTLHEMKRIFQQHPDKRYVVNLSLQYCEGTEASEEPCAEMPSEVVVDEALAWRNGMRTLRLNPNDSTVFDYEGKVIQISAAGNNAGRDAAFASAVNAAVLLGNIPDIQAGTDSAQLQNGIVVENRTATLVNGIPRPDCINIDIETGSNRGGNIGAIGTAVISFGAPEPGSVPTVVASGTSMAAPQVTGLVAWMLATRPNLATDKVLETLRNNSYRPSPSVGDPCTEAPMIDALAAMLSLDLENKDGTLDVRVRVDRLRPNAQVPSTTFSYADAEQFLRKIFARAYGPEPAPQTNPTFTEFDLNGDGFISDDSRRVPFNLRFDEGLGAWASYKLIKTYPTGSLIELDEMRVSDFEVLCYYVNSSLYAGGPDLQKFNDELKRISPLLGRPISCASPAVTLQVNTTNPSWTGLPANIVLSNFTQMNKILFSVSGSPGNTCLTGERGGPIFSSQVDPLANFQAASTVTGLPQNIGGAGINRRPCSSFYAERAFGPGIDPQVWINATGRGQTFGGVSRDWEIQVRYSNGDTRDPFRLGRRCEVGVVPNSGIFSKNFDAVCTHTISQIISQ